MEYVVKVSVERDGRTSIHYVEATDWRAEFDEGVRLLVTERQCRVTLERCDEAPESGFVPGIRFYRETCGGT